MASSTAAVQQEQPKVIILCKATANDVNRNNNNNNPLVQKGQKMAQILSTQFSVQRTSVRVVTAPGDAVSVSILNATEGDDGDQSSCTSKALLVVLSCNDDDGVSGIVEWIDHGCLSPRVVVGGDEPAERAAARVAKLVGLSDPVVSQRIRAHRTRLAQSALVADAQARTHAPRYQQRIAGCYEAGTQITGDKIVLDGAGDDIIEKTSGKVRDRYDWGGDSMALVTTDRQSGFDRMLALVPYKGQVLNLTSAFWFEKTRHIIPNHLLSVPHPNVSIVKKCTPFPIEFVVRAYVTGSTSTSIWKNYEQGVRNYCGHELPEGLYKNQKLWKLLLTPTTKEEEHDRPISPQDIVQEKWMTQADLDTCGAAVLDCFRLGQRVAADHGLILVDTKYEMGKDSSGNIIMIDEMHTPDSSRYWLASTYEERIRQGWEPENIDKEFLRLWFKERCDPYKDEVIPEAPPELVTELSRRYISLFEMITGRDFAFGDEDTSTEENISVALQNAVSSSSS